jgi:hypothetical protein
MLRASVSLWFSSPAPTVGRQAGKVNHAKTKHLFG